MKQKGALFFSTMVACCYGFLILRPWFLPEKWFWDQNLRRIFGKPWLHATMVPAYYGVYVPYFPEICAMYSLMKDRYREKVWCRFWWTVVHIHHVPSKKLNQAKMRMKMRMKVPQIEHESSADAHESSADWAWKFREAGSFCLSIVCLSDRILSVSIE